MIDIPQPIINQAIFFGFVILIAIGIVAVLIGSGAVYRWLLRMFKS